jgi:hypothetical protein
LIDPGPADVEPGTKAEFAVTAFIANLVIRGHSRSVKYKRARPKAVSYVQPSVFDMLAGANPASAREGWAE